MIHYFLSLLLLFLSLFLFLFSFLLLLLLLLFFCCCYDYDHDHFYYMNEGGYGWRCGKSSRLLYNDHLTAVSAPGTVNRRRGSMAITVHSSTALALTRQGRGLGPDAEASRARRKDVFAWTAFSGSAAGVRPPSSVPPSPPPLLPSPPQFRPRSLEGWEGEERTGLLLVIVSLIVLVRVLVQVLVLVLAFVLVLKFKLVLKFVMILIL
ncbi:hypothetical protein T492DRAFT_329921 [Pavlovales sp. CCMP2436]|nr:hypothetical protein T492DRAFT_329921 [Pavlovales sp. CCMP2436]